MNRQKREIISKWNEREREIKREEKLKFKGFYE